MCSIRCGGALLDPRGVDDTGLSGYHFGIDVIDDRHLGRVRACQPAKDDRPRPCAMQQLQVGHFSDCHVSPIVPVRAYVKAGEQIG